VPVNLKEWTDTLWVAQSRLYHTNSGILLAAGQACLIDPGIYPGEIEGLIHFLAERNAAPQALVLTHSHWDHLLGPERFPGVPVVAQESYLSEMEKDGSRIRRDISRWEGQSGIKREKPFCIPLPDQVFVNSTTLQVGSLSLKLVHAPGHASDELVVYDLGSGALWAGDMLSDLEIPFVSDSLPAYQQILDMLATWDIRLLVPGHGHPARHAAEIEARISEDRMYLAELRERVGQALAEGANIEETVTRCSAMGFRHPEENAGPHRLNVESAYIEFGGEADPSRVGWGQAFEQP
jgi:glyoxylase-like metal-dependent hydrolase (beta-lactamase superfamily II)